MSVTNINTTSELSAARELCTMMQGRVVLRGDDDYARTRRIWNGAVENEPALFAVCETSADVQAGVRVARHHGLPFSVRGGGHHWAGPALCHDGLVIDLSRMRQVIVDPHSRVATIQGGARLKDVAATADAHGLVAALGNWGVRPGIRQPAWRRSGARRRLLESLLRCGVACLQFWFQDPSQPHSSPVQSDFHERGTDIQYVRRFIYIEFFYITQKEHLSVALRKHLDGPLK